MIEITTLSGDTTFPASRSDPQGHPPGAVAVIQEIFRVNAGIRRKSPSQSAEGYRAIASESVLVCVPGGWVS